MRALRGRSTAIDLQVWMLRRMDAWGRRLGRGSRMPEHLATGLRGEREALFHLRTLGYTVVARRWKSAKLRGDVDLIGWDGEWLCFIEVKTRTGRDAMSPAESAVDDDKQEMLRKMARAYLRGFPEKLRREVPVRFDIVSVYLQQGCAEFDVYKSAFGWSDSSRN
jgi:putative endonuclease